MPCHPCILGGAQHRVRGENQKWLPHPCLLGGPEEGGSAASPLHSRGSPTPSAVRKSEVATSPLAFSRAQKREEVLRHPCILGGPQRQACEENQKGLPDLCLLGGPKEGGNAMSPLHSRGCPTPSAGRKSDVATSPLPSRGPKRGRKCYFTPAFSGVPNTKRGEKIRSGYLTDAFSGAQKRAEMLCHPCILGGPQRQAWGEDQKWLPHAYLLGGPKEGGNAPSPLHSRESPTPSAGIKSEVAISPLPSRAQSAMSPLHSRGSPTPSAPMPSPGPR